MQIMAQLVFYLCYNGGARGSRLLWVEPHGGGAISCKSHFIPRVMIFSIHKERSHYSASHVAHLFPSPDKSILSSQMCSRAVKEEQVFQLEEMVL